MNAKKKGILLCLFLLFLLIPAGTVGASASYTWKSVGNGNYRCYKNGKKLVKSEWVGSRHLNASGYMDRNKWVKREVKGKKTRVFVRDDGKWVKDFKEGWQEIRGKYYYYTAEGKLYAGGWLRNKKGKMYYVDSLTRTRVTGLQSISGKLYFFAANGVLRTDRTITYLGRQYVADKRGVCVLVRNAGTPGADMLFFLTFESGSEAYNQTGGDHGNACGAYQFDNRYSLLPFVKYAYAKNSTLCSEFKEFAALRDGTKLKSNQAFYTAWKKVYARNPQLFAELQDNFAKEQYYDPVERMLSNVGIDLASRPDVVKGAVYSYSIQHGQTAAYNAVRASGIKSTTSNADFLQKLYDYRMRSFPRYRSRYSSEYLLALSKL